MVIGQGNRSWKSTVKLLDKLSEKTKIPSNSVVLKLNLELPDALFKKPQLEASITIDNDQVSKPLINGQTIHNIQEIVSQQLGVDLSINVVEPVQ